MTQYDLFGNPIDDGQDEQEKKKGKDEKGEKTKNNSKNNKKGQNSKDTKINEPMKVQLYGQSIGPEGEEHYGPGWTLEQIRQDLEKDFPELSKDRTEMIVDKEKKLVIPVIKAAKKGNRKGYFKNMSDLLKEPSLINILHTGNAVYEVRVTEVGVFTKLLEGEPACNLEGFTPNLPKIPSSILTDYIMPKFREKAKKNLECAAQIFWDREKQKYFLFFPRQDQKRFTVDIYRDIELEFKHLLVMDIHSHHNMPARFSPDDNLDEKEPRIFAVVGRVLENLPHLNTRISISGNYVHISPLQVFTQPLNFHFIKGEEIADKKQCV